MVCIDTTLIIDLVLGRISKDKIAELLGSEYAAYIPSPCAMELIKGMHLSRNKMHITEAERQKVSEVLQSAESLPLDLASAKRAGKLEADLVNRGETIDPIDVMIAAITLENNQELLTKNHKHFSRIPKLRTISY